MKSQLPACPKEVNKLQEPKLFFLFSHSRYKFRRCWRACNTILSQQQALAKQAQKHTACLEAHDQVQNYSCLSVGVCTLVSHLFCESTELSLQTITCEEIDHCLHPFSTLMNPGGLLLKRNMNSMIPFALENYTLGCVGYAKDWLHIILQKVPPVSGLLQSWIKNVLEMVADSNLVHFL